MLITIKRKDFGRLIAQADEAKQRVLQRVARETFEQVLSQGLVPLRDGQNEVNEVCNAVEDWVERMEGRR